MMTNMILTKIESWLSNSYFLVSFLTTIYYWIKTIFFKKKPLGFYGFIGFLSINILLIIQLITRWIDSGHFPLSSLYESLLFLCWALTTVYLVLEYFIQTELIGVLVSPLVLCLVGFAGFSLPIDLQQTKPLVPALQSNWLFMHVSVMILSYAGLLIGSLLSLTYWIIYTFIVTPELSFSNTEIPSTILPSADSAVQLHGNKIIPSLTKQINSNKKNSTLEKFLILFDNLSYRTIGIGFCFLTLGILSGAVWANETWGTYWSWDPKETWALITWLTFAVYLHTRLLYGWQGIKPARIGTLGFLLIWVCYLGVNLLGKGLHSYGFLT